MAQAVSICPSTSSSPLTALQATLENRASLPTIVNIALTYPRGFITYCTISNTVKAIGIGGSASLFLSAKFTSFIASSEEADARNLVALTRSKGLSVILLPPATQFVASPLHSLLTQCAFRHGIFYVGAEDFDIEALAEFISQPDTTQDGEPAVYTSASWLHTHTKFPHSALGTPFPCASLSHLTLKSHTLLIIKSSLTPEQFPCHYGRIFRVEHPRVVEFPFPTATASLLESQGFGLWPVSVSHFFARPSHGIGHKHPIRASTPTPPPPRPLKIQRWPVSSPATSTPELPEYQLPPPPAFLSPKAQSSATRELSLSSGYWRHRSENWPPC